MIWAVRHYDDEKALILCGDEDSEVHVFLVNGSPTVRT